MKNPKSKLNFSVQEGDEIIIGPPRVLAKLKDGDSVKKFERKNKNAA